MDQVIEDAAHYLGVFDNDIIYSWTPHEYRLKIKGAQLREIDQLESSARNAMMIAIASTKKGTTQKKLFDADKARKRLEQGDKQYKDSRVINLSRYRKAKKAMAEYMSNQQKGG